VGRGGYGLGGWGFQGLSSHRMEVVENDTVRVKHWHGVSDCNTFMLICSIFLCVVIHPS